jgi:hypothetical protein
MLRRAVVLVSASLVVSVSHGARADAPASPAPQLPPAPIALSVTPAEGGSWKVRVDNSGDAPVRLAADVALVWLEIESPPGTAKKGARAPATVRCSLPASSRPDNDDDSALVVPGKRSWSATFDPRLLCFGAKERAALAPGAKVTAHLGFPSGKATRPPRPPMSPFAVTPVGAAFGKWSPAKELVAPPVTLMESTLPPEPSPSKVTTDEPKLELGITPFTDSQRGRAINVRLTLTSRASRNVTLLYRTTTVAFDVDGPKGHVECDRPAKGGTPIRELYTRLPAGGRAAIDVLLDVKCPADTFTAPGIYRVKPILDTREADGFEAGLSTFNGEVTGGEGILRVREWQRESARERPSLD